MGTLWPSGRITLLGAAVSDTCGSAASERPAVKRSTATAAKKFFMAELR
jgi:hypothetical protein